MCSPESSMEALQSITTGHSGKSQDSQSSKFGREALGITSKTE